MDKRSGVLGRRSLVRLGAGASMLSLGPAYRAPARAADAVKAAAGWARTNLPNSTPEIVAAAATEGKLTLLLFHETEDANVDTMVGRFKARYPFIDVAYTTQATTQVINRFNAELSSKSGVSDYLQLPANLGQASSYVAAGAIASFVISQDDAFPDPAKRRGTWYASQQDLSLTVYRVGALSAEEKQLIRTYKGLADPRFKGRLGINNVNNSVAVVGTYTLLNDGDESAWRGLVANKPQVKPSTAVLMDGLLSGEYDVAVFAAYSTVSSTIKGGAPLECGVSFPSPALYTPGAISALAPHPNAARLWQDWITSKEGQDAWTSLVGAMSARSDVHGAWLQQQPWFFDEPQRAAPIDWAELSRQQLQLVERFRNDIAGR